MAESLKVLFVPFGPDIGHVNVSIGVAEVLLSAGHRPIFLIDSHWKARLRDYGIDSCDINDDSMEDKQNMDTNHVKELSTQMVRTGGIGPKTALQKVVNRGRVAADWMHRAIKLDKLLVTLLPSIAPNLIIAEQLLSIPAIELSGIPYVWLSGSNHLGMCNDNRLPPSTSGLSATDVKEWQIFRDVRNRAVNEVWIQCNDYVISRGCQPLKENEFANNDKCLNIYGCPLELDYHDLRPLPKNYIRFDNLMRIEKKIQFEIPVELRDRPGKLVYFSLGSMGAADVDNMKRLVNILSKSKHRFIVSKGPLYDEYSLADNMWGEGSVPQIQVLPLVDLVITHGGNNTVTETFHFGKPMIVLPLFGDQWDNAQRVHEKGFGIRLDAYKCSEEELLNAIESLLNNKELNEKLMKISHRIQSDNSIAKLPEIIEDFIQNPQKYKF
ncbi:unnamed protein product [Medioppia subpectinata]|uniref:UDP-glycosyltransferase n=1 Tax=Medioppia subpectinata TaxID=1979941 RepID=A0A7R9PUC1_9ACAR|nr:unnamed protein product [Medioppia subpectinata]CAG2101365.1 unnamed protein product [Medioppia subpectinata]